MLPVVWIDDLTSFANERKSDLVQFKVEFSPVRTRKDMAKIVLARLAIMR